MTSSNPHAFSRYADHANCIAFLISAARSRPIASDCARSSAVTSSENVPAANAALSKKRAQAVKAALVTSGIADASVALVKPAETTDTKVDDAAARRVEVVVQ